jgi:hypothetical protein
MMLKIKVIPYRMIVMLSVEVLVHPRRSDVGASLQPRIQNPECRFLNSNMDIYTFVGQHSKTTPHSTTPVSSIPPKSTLSTSLSPCKNPQVFSPPLHSCTQNVPENAELTHARRTRNSRCRSKSPRSRGASKPPLQMDPNYWRPRHHQPYSEQYERKGSGGHDYLEDY